MSGWIGVDLDGTLAHYGGWKGVDHIGDPVPAMAERVRAWLEEGREVRIFTARIYAPHDDEKRLAEVAEAAAHIASWCERHFGRALPITCTKDFGMIELWDDRAVQIELNTGRRMDGRP